METLARFQERNCHDCFFVDEAEVGTGGACCTYPQQIKLEDGKCLTKKEEHEAVKRMVLELGDTSHA